MFIEKVFVFRGWKGEENLKCSEICTLVLKGINCHNLITERSVRFGTLNLVQIRRDFCTLKVPKEIRSTRWYNMQIIRPLRARTLKFFMALRKFVFNACENR